MPVLADSIAGLLALCAIFAPYHRERTGAGRRTRAAGYAEALGARWNSLCPPPTGSEFAGAAARACDQVEWRQNMARAWEADPDIWQLDNGDIAVIGRDLTAAYRPQLPEGVALAPDERLVVIPGNMLSAAKAGIADAWSSRPYPSPLNRARGMPA